jgi:hypothetical protein
MDKLSENQPISDNPDESHPVQVIDVDDIMATIRQGEQVGRNSPLPPLEDLTLPQPADPEGNTWLYFLLGQTNRPLSQAFLVTRTVKPSKLDTIPLLGSLWYIVRNQLHSLSIYYVNQLARQFIMYNRQVVTLIDLIVRQNQQQAVELANLKQRVSELEARLIGVEDNI